MDLNISEPVSRSEVRRAAGAPEEEGRSGGADRLTDRLSWAGGWLACLRVRTDWAGRSGTVLYGKRTSKKKCVLWVLILTS